MVAGAQYRPVIDQNVVHGRGTDVVRHVQCGRRVPLRVEVDHEDTRAVLGQAGGQVHRGGGLADAALLVGDGHDPATRGSRPGLAAATYSDGRLRGPGDRSVSRIRRDIGDDHGAGFT